MLSSTLGRCRALVLKESSVSHFSCPASNFSQLGLSPLSSFSPSPALLDGCIKVVLQQTDRDLKTKWAVSNPRYLISPKSWEHAVPVLLWGNAVVTQQHGPFWWQIPHWEQTLGQVSSACPADPRALLRVTATVKHQTPHMLSLAFQLRAFTLQWV